jgi:hypothetical protein
MTSFAAIQLFWVYCLRALYLPLQKGRKFASKVAKVSVVRIQARVVRSSASWVRYFAMAVLSLAVSFFAAPDVSWFIVLSPSAAVLRDCGRRGTSVATTPLPSVAFFCSILSCPGRRRCFETRKPCRGDRTSSVVSEKSPINQPRFRGLGRRVAHTNIACQDLRSETIKKSCRIESESAG